MSGTAHDARKTQNFTILFLYALQAFEITPKGYCEVSLSCNETASATQWSQHIILL
jgi:hypothetical protein